MAKYTLVSPEGNETATDSPHYAIRLRSQGYSIKREDRQEKTQPMKSEDKPRKHSDPGEINGDDK